MFDWIQNETKFCIRSQILNDFCIEIRNWIDGLFGSWILDIDSSIRHFTCKFLHVFYDPTNCFAPIKHIDIVVDDAIVPFGLNAI